MKVLSTYPSVSDARNLSDGAFVQDCINGTICRQRTGMTAIFIGNEPHASQVWDGWSAAHRPQAPGFLHLPHSTLLWLSDAQCNRAQRSTRQQSQRVLAERFPWVSKEWQRRFHCNEAGGRRAILLVIFFRWNASCCNACPASTLQIALGPLVSQESASSWMGSIISYMHLYLLTLYQIRLTSCCKDDGLRSCCFVHMGGMLPKETCTCRLCCIRGQFWPRDRVVASILWYWRTP